MEDAGSFFILIGGLFLIGLLVSPLARVLRVPRVTLLLLSGIALGPYGLELDDDFRQEWFPFIADMTLMIIGYLLGTRLTPEYIKKYATGVLISSIIITIVTSAVVALALMLLGVNTMVAIVLGAVAAATDPAAMVDVLQQRKKRTTFGDMLSGIVAMDDVLGLLVFSIALAMLGLLSRSNGVMEPLLHMIYEISGSLALGSLAGYVVAKLLNGKRDDQPVIVESLAFILLLGGISIYVHVSYLLAAMTMGAVVVNLVEKKGASHLHEIEYIEQPFLVLFFILAGASLNLEGGETVLKILVLFVVLRVVGRFVGGWLVPAKYIGKQQRLYVGVALLPQAGVAMGMALVASNRYPEIAGIVLPIAISATVVFEIIGPVITARVLDHVDKPRERAPSRYS